MGYLRGKEPPLGTQQIGIIADKKSDWKKIDKLKYWLSVRSKPELEFTKNLFLKFLLIREKTALMDSMRRAIKNMLERKKAATYFFVFLPILSLFLFPQTKQKIPPQLKILSPAETYWTAEIENIIFSEEPQQGQKLSVGVRIKFTQKRTVPGIKVDGCFFKGPLTNSSEPWSKIMSLRLMGIKYSENEINLLKYEGPTPPFPPYEYQGFPVIGFVVTAEDLKKGSMEIWKWTSQYPLSSKEGIILASLAIYNQPPYNQKNECHPHPDFKKSFRPKPTEPKEIERLTKKNIFDLAIIDIKLKKNLPPSFAVKIENLGGQDFMDEVYVNIDWLVGNQSETLGHQKFESLKAGQVKELEITIKDENIINLLEENKIIIPGKQKVKAALWFSSSISEKKDPKENNELFFEFYWDPPVNLLWTINFGLKGPDYPYFIEIDDQDNWLIAGNITSAQTTDVVVRKGDLKGNLLWEKSFNSGLTDEISLFESLGDGTFLLGLRSFPGSSGNLCSSIIMRIDSTGNPLWQKRFFKEQKYVWLKKAIKTKDSFIYLLGNSDGLGIGQDDILIIKMDTDGHILWMKSFGTADGKDYLDEINKPILIGDKIYFLGRRFYQDQEKNWIKQQIVYLFDQSKEITTAKEFRIIPLSDSKIDFKLLGFSAKGDLIASGRLTEKTKTIDFLCQIDLNNQIKWAKAFSLLEPKTIFTEPDGGILVGAGLSEKALILNLNSRGEMVWGKWYGILTTGSGYSNIPLSINRTSKNTILVLGQSNIFSVPEKFGDSLRSWDDMYLMHLDKSGKGTIFLWNYDLASGLKGAIELKTGGLELLLQSRDGDDFSITPAQVKIEPIKSNLTSRGKTKYSW